MRPLFEGLLDWRSLRVIFHSQKSCFVIVKIFFSKEPKGICNRKKEESLLLLPNKMHTFFKHPPLKERENNLSLATFFIFHLARPGGNAKSMKTATGNKPLPLEKRKQNGQTLEAKCLFCRFFECHLEQKELSNAILSRERELRSQNHLQFHENTIHPLDCYVLTRHLSGKIWRSIALFIGYGSRQRKWIAVKKACRILVP